MSSGNLLVAFQGEHGAFSEEAVLKNKDVIAELSGVKSRLKTIPYSSFEDVVRSVDEGRVDYGILPIENSQEGTISETYDLLIKYNVYAVLDIKLRVVHCLISHKDAEIEDIKRIYSHIQGLKQCSNFIDRYRWEKIPTYNTAGSVRIISEHNDKSEAAIASKKAASIYNMKILEEGIENNDRNYTRFFIISKNPQTKLRYLSDYLDIPIKTTIIFSTYHIPGALYSCIGELAKRNINISKLESRPNREKNWEYFFFLDFEGNMEDKKCIEAIENLGKKTSFFKTLGSYICLES
ncbi:MAG: prephenate dehydratase [Candidatus Methanoliparum thermophilum]|uniref:prephenate dehydratase n=1 Tax=Methanoliparum thermophilum TaxID=2491083 RepID=A0A520KRQ2_METT2|nr:prephenate dehydratase [Candidatus Methanoliparum sp. LAM-1]RZN64464.1 MAG: prephenate dehydratase [Candidatus Methanoliparum thermophilum]BDC35948.1 prephenate dehydratase [Candidatus Methanoliparum sp. LAM-1]